MQTVTFVDRLHGWAIGTAASLHIFKTSDGGSTWTERTCPGSRATDITFVDQQHGWLVGFLGFMMATVDGGETWNPQQPPSYASPGDFTGPCCDWGRVMFADTSHGWATADFCAGAVAATSDGGAHWALIHSCQKDTPPWALSMGDLHHGIGVYGAEYSFTRDGGASWTAQPTPRGVDGPAMLIDASRGWLIQGNEVFATDDGGVTWKKTGTTPSDDVLSWVWFVDATHGWVSGQRKEPDGPWPSVVLATTDGGATWANQTVDPSSGAPVIRFVDPAHGWAAAGQGGLYATSDGGVTWTRQLAPGPEN